MKKLFAVASVVFLLSMNLAAQSEGEMTIIPRPNSVKRSDGNFNLTAKTKIVASEKSGSEMAGLLNSYLQKSRGMKLSVAKSGTGGAISFELAKDLAKDEYALQISPKGIVVKASGDLGMFYGLQSLIQLIPQGKGALAVTGFDIKDKPRFKYRGLHLDVGRHFFSVEFVKKYIDLMSQYKMNFFHWHLTEDQGWRIEIKKYPKLTEIGSKRPETVKGRVLNPYVGDGVPVEGFYTQDQIKDVVAYAKARKITVIPEIEIPGHSSAALAAYPQFACKADWNYKVQTTWGIFKEVYCPTEETFKFLQDILDEVIALFPDAPYIHIGGDEVLKDHWKESTYVQELMKRENLKDEHEVQSYFIRRIEKYINSKGKRIIGWDEILEGGLAPDATVMSWRGIKGGIEAAKAGHDVIMTPGEYAYLDHGQGDPSLEPINIGAFLTLEKVYSYDPIPAELNDDEKKFIIGAQGNVWTEYMKTPEKVEYMAFPRALAMAEVGWTEVNEKSYPDFTYRLAWNLDRLDSQNVGYRIPEPIGLKNEIVSDSDTVMVDWRTINRGARIFYTLDGSEPTTASMEYNGAFPVKISQNGKVLVKLIVVLPNGRKSTMFTATFVRRPLVEPVTLTLRSPGVKYGLYSGRFDSVAQMDSLTPFETGETRNINLNQFLKRDKNSQTDDWGVLFDGYINISEDGLYEFQLDADDGSVLMIGDEKVVDNDGAHTLSTAAGIVPLKKGLHRFRIKFFQRGGEIGLAVRYGLKGRPLNRLMGAELFH